MTSPGDRIVTSLGSRIVTSPGLSSKKKTGSDLLGFCLKTRLSNRYTQFANSRTRTRSPEPVAPPPSHQNPEVPKPNANPVRGLPNPNPRPRTRWVARNHCQMYACMCTPRPVGTLRLGRAYAPMAANPDPCRACLSSGGPRCRKARLASVATNLGVVASLPH